MVHPAIPSPDWQEGDHVVVRLGQPIVGTIIANYRDDEGDERFDVRCRFGSGYWRTVRGLLWDDLGAPSVAPHEFVGLGRSSGTVRRHCRWCAQGPDAVIHLPDPAPVESITRYRTLRQSA